MNSNYGLNLSNYRVGSVSKWEEEFKCHFEEVEWEALFSFNIGHKLTQYNLIHRIYYIPDRLHRIKPHYSQFCPRYKSGIGTLILVFWARSCLHPYWTSTLIVLKDITGITIPTEQRVILLGDTSMIKAYKNKLKSKNCPYHSHSMERWATAYSGYHEKIMHNLKGKSGEFKKIWGGFITFGEFTTFDSFYSHTIIKSNSKILMFYLAVFLALFCLLYWFLFIQCWKKIVLQYVLCIPFLLYALNIKSPCSF